MINLLGFPVHGLDLAFFVLMLVFTLTGAVRGLSRELGGLIVAGLTLWVGRTYIGPLGAFIAARTKLIDNEARLAAVLVIVLGGGLAWLIVRLVFKYLLNLTFKGHLERIGGAVLGFLKGFVLSVLIVLLVAWWIDLPEARKGVLEDSWFGRRAAQFAPDVYRKAAARYDLPALPPVPPVPDAGPRPAADGPATPALAPPAAPGSEPIGEKPPAAPGVQPDGPGDIATPAAAERKEEPIRLQRPPPPGTLPGEAGPKPIDAPP